MKTALLLASLLGLALCIAAFEPVEDAEKEVEEANEVAEATNVEDPNEEDDQEDAAEESSDSVAKDSWVIGDGIGGTEVRVGKVASKLACYVLCYHRKMNGVLANGATVDTKTGTNCYCEYGMKKRNRVKKWMTTFINRASWKVGDGVGGTEVKIGTFKSKVHCYAMCRSRTKNGVLANGATVDSATGKICYCEFGMNSRNTVKKWTTTFITRAYVSHDEAEKEVDDSADVEDATEEDATQETSAEANDLAEGQESDEQEEDVNEDEEESDVAEATEQAEDAIEKQEKKNPSYYRRRRYYSRRRYYRRRYYRRRYYSRRRYYRRRYYRRRYYRRRYYRRRYYRRRYYRRRYYRRRYYRRRYYRRRYGKK